MKVFKVEDVAALLELSDKTIRAQIKEGILKAAKFGNQYRISALDLEDYYRKSGGGSLGIVRETDKITEEPKGYTKEASIKKVRNWLPTSKFEKHFWKGPPLHSLQRFVVKMICDEPLSSEKNISVCIDQVLFRNQFSESSLCWHLKLKQNDRLKNPRISWLLLSRGTGKTFILKFLHDYFAKVAAKNESSLLVTSIPRSCIVKSTNSQGESETRNISYSVATRVRYKDFIFTGYDEFSASFLPEDIRMFDIFGMITVFTVDKAPEDLQGGRVIDLTEYTIHKPDLRSTPFTVDPLTEDSNLKNEDKITDFVFSKPLP